MIINIGILNVVKNLYDCLKCSGSLWLLLLLAIISMIGGWWFGNIYSISLDNYISVMLGLIGLYMAVIVLFLGFCKKFTGILMQPIPDKNKGVDKLSSDLIIDDLFSTLTVGILLCLIGIFIIPFSVYLPWLSSYVKSGVIIMLILWTVHLTFHLFTLRSFIIKDNTGNAENP